MRKPKIIAALSLLLIGAVVAVVTHGQNDFTSTIKNTTQPRLVASTTPVTSSNPTINTDQNLIQLSLSAGVLNTLTQPFEITGSGIYSSTAASSPALTIKAKLCTVSGCGSGTVVPLFSIVTTALNTTALTNATWNLIGTCVTSTIGATGNLNCHGSPGLTLDTGATLTTPDSVFADTNTATLANIDLTAALFIQFTVAQSVVGASNSYTQQIASIR